MRNYRKEYDNYQGTEEQKKNRAQRNTARRQAKAKGLNIQGKDVAHIKARPREAATRTGSLSSLHQRTVALNETKTAA